MPNLEEEHRTRFEELHREHFEAVRRYAWRRDAGSADDIAAETFLVAWRRLDEVPEDARPWLIGVARNVRLNLLRSQRRQASVAGALEAARPPVRDDATAHELPEPVAAALAALSSRDREILLHAWDELGRDEIAVALGCTKAYASVRLHRAKRRFEQALQRTSAARRDPGRIGLTTSEGANHGS